MTGQTRLRDENFMREAGRERQLDDVALDAWLKRRTLRHARPTINQFIRRVIEPDLPTRHAVPQIRPARKKPGGKPFHRHTWWIASSASCRRFIQRVFLSPNNTRSAPTTASLAYVLTSWKGSKGVLWNWRCRMNRGLIAARLTSTRSRRSRSCTIRIPKIGLRRLRVSLAIISGCQIDRWSKQYKLSETETIDEMNRLIEWLPQTIPAGERTSIVHGDYRLDNMVLQKRTARHRGARLGFRRSAIRWATSPII